MPDDSEAAALLDGGLSELSAGLAELRELARGIHPAVLTERGLGAGPRLAGRPRAGAGDDHRRGRADRLPPAVETAAYFVVAEALTNVAKYAERDAPPRSRSGARTATCVIEVEDDGVGGADPGPAAGCAGSRTASPRSTAACRSRARPAAGPVVRAEIPVG